jgi:AraC-like DNA-binding protein
MTRDVRLTEAGGVIVGEFCTTPGDRDFATAGRITRHCFVFPRRSVWIAHEHTAAFVADPTRLTMYNPGEAYERRALDPAGDRADWINVSDDLARSVVARFDERAAQSDRRVFVQPFAPASPDLYLAGRRLHEYVRRTPEPDLLFVEETAVDLLARTVAAVYAGTARGERDGGLVAPRTRDIVEDTRAHLNRSYRRNESLTSIADDVGTSVFHLCRLFRRGTGMTMHAYRHQLRLRRSLEPLERKRADLLTVALEFGYSGHSHFTAAFKRSFGVVPSQLRDRMATSC